MTTFSAAALLPGLGIPIPNPLDLVGEHAVAAVRALFRAVEDDFLANLAAPIARYVLRTPDLLAEPGLTRAWGVSLGCLLAVAGLLVALAGAASVPGRS